MYNYNRYFYTFIKDITGDIMNTIIKEFSIELNTISRLAIIENAAFTEKYIHKYSSVVKYKYSNSSKKLLLKII